MQLVTAANPSIIDKDLWYCVAAFRTRQHLLLQGWFKHHVELFVFDPFAVEQPLGRMAKSAKRAGINLNFGHVSVSRGRLISPLDIYLRTVLPLPAY